LGNEKKVREIAAGHHSRRQDAIAEEESEKRRGRGTWINI
jgi:hypothetical protein